MEAGPERTLAQLMATGSEEERKTMQRHLMRLAGEKLGSLTPKTKSVLYKRLGTLVNRTSDDIDLLLQIATHYMSRFFEAPIRVVRADGDNRPDWMVFMEHPSPDKPSSGMDQVVHEMTRGPRGRTGRPYRDANGRVAKVSVFSSDQPVRNPNGANSGDIDLRETLEDESAIGALESADRRLMIMQFREKLNKHAEACISAIENLPADARLATRKILAAAFVRLVTSGRVTDADINRIIVKRQVGHTTIYDFNGLALVALFEKFGFHTSDKTAEKAIGLFVQVFNEQILKRAPGGCHVEG